MLICQHCAFHAMYDDCTEVNTCRDYPPLTLVTSGHVVVGHTVEPTYSDAWCDGCGEGMSGVHRYEAAVIGR